MKLVCLAIGKKHDPSIASAIEDYTKRLQYYTPLTWQIVPAAKGKMSTDEARRAESTSLLATCQNDDYIVLLDEIGTQMNSRELADIFNMSGRHGRRIIFIIGGPYGVTDEFKQRADFIWSLSNLTFPHQLVRLILVEQLYRASTIRRGEPYHHE